jgi:hypothetical protein
MCEVFYSNEVWIRPLESHLKSIDKQLTTVVQGVFLKSQPKFKRIEFSFNSEKEMAAMRRTPRFSDITTPAKNRRRCSMLTRSGKRCLCKVFSEKSDAYCYVHFSKAEYFSEAEAEAEATALIVTSPRFRHDTFRTRVTPGHHRLLSGIMTLFLYIIYLMFVSDTVCDTVDGIINFITKQLHHPTTTLWSPVSHTVSPPTNGTNVTSFSELIAFTDEQTFDNRLFYADHTSLYPCYIMTSSISVYSPYLHFDGYRNRTNVYVTNSNVESQKW